MRVLLVVLLAAVVAATGCIRTDAGLGAADDGALRPFVDPIVDDHDHAAFADHALWTPSMSLVGWTPLGEDGKPYSYIGEIDMHGDLLVVQVLGRGSTPGFVLVDVSDPANPTPVGRASMTTSYVVDVKFSPDGKSVFAASQAGPTRSRAQEPVRPDFGGLVSSNGFVQWDVSDPSRPMAVAGALVEPFGCHMLAVKELAGKLTVFCVAEAVHVFQYSAEGAWSPVATMGPGTSIKGLPRIVEEVAAAGAGAPNAARLSATPHDITIQEDPKTPGRWLASVSYWDWGLRIFDVTDPARPVELGAWAGEGAQVYEGNVHGATMTILNDRRVVVVGPEILGNGVPSLWVLDIDDLAAPTLIAEWVPPGAHGAQSLRLTVHQFQLVQDRLYLAYNHAGVWVLDLPAVVAGAYKDDPARPEILGYYLPHMEVELFNPETPGLGVPHTWDVNVRNGYIFASDRYTGLYVLRHEGDAPGDETITSFS